MTDLTSCWFQTDSLYDSMNLAIKNHLPLDQIGHGKVLISLVDMVDKEGLEFIDVGAGGSLIHTIVKGKYTGADLSHVIENVSKKCFPDLSYINCDLVDDDLSFLKNYDIILLNAILDIMEDPLFILNKIIKQSRNYVIVHRQQISNTYLPNGFILTKEPSYGGITFRTNIERKIFENIIKDNNFLIVKELDSGLGLLDNKSFLLKKEC